MLFCSVRSLSQPAHAAAIPSSRRHLHEMPLQCDVIASTTRHREPALFGPTARTLSDDEATTTSCRRIIDAVTKLTELSDLTWANLKSVFMI